MIINTYDDPKKSYYFVGCIIIKVLIHNNQALRLSALYKNTYKVYRCTYKLFISTILWLYIEGVVEYKNGVCLKW